MRSGELIASLAGTALASHAKLARSHSNLSALDRRKRAFRALAAIAVGLAAFAHEAAPQDRVYRIGILQGVPVPEGEQAFDDEMRAKGYDVGRNFQKDIRYTQGQSDRIPACEGGCTCLVRSQSITTSFWRASAASSRC